MIALVLVSLGIAILVSGVVMERRWMWLGVAVLAIGFGVKAAHSGEMPECPTHRIIGAEVPQ